MPLNAKLEWTILAVFNSPFQTLQYLLRDIRNLSSKRCVRQVKWRARKIYIFPAYFTRSKEIVGVDVIKHMVLKICSQELYLLRHTYANFVSHRMLKVCSKRTLISKTYETKIRIKMLEFMPLRFPVEWQPHKIMTK